MKVKELIEELSKVDPEAMVIVRGYEDGYDEVDHVGDSKPIALNVHKEWYYGKHDDVGSYATEGKEYETTMAVWIGA